METLIRDGLQKSFIPGPQDQTPKTRTPRLGLRALKVKQPDITGRLRHPPSRGWQSPGAIAYDVPHSSGVPHGAAPERTG